MAERASAQRADAAENRRLILESAHRALTVSCHASLNSIAADAGVANATLYRHFRTRQSLVLAVYRYEVNQVVELCDELLGTVSAEDAFRQWIQRLAQYAMTKPGLGEALRTATGPGADVSAETYDLIVGALGRLLEAAAGSGSIRSGLSPDLVILAFAGLWQIDPASDWRATADQLYEVVFAGLCP
jgi:AcrR family transcriptional regulator